MPFYLILGIESRQLTESTAATMPIHFEKNSDIPQCVVS